MRNKFENKNAEHWMKWIFRKEDHLPLVSVYFLSRRNSTSPRFFPLYNYSSKIRIVVFYGSRLPYLDRIYLKLLPFFVQYFKTHFERYEAMFLFGLKRFTSPRLNQILHFDDPEYTKDEWEYIQNWEKQMYGIHKVPIIVCTSTYTQNYLREKGFKSTIKVISQGHNSIPSFKVENESTLTAIGRKVKFAYASPYIHADGDLHGGHINWDVSEFLNSFAESILQIPNVEIHLIGNVGENARRRLPSNPRLILHGFQSFEQCSEILKSCDVGIYPRQRDNFRQAQKIFEYIGAGLAIIAFDLIDTSPVSEFQVGLVSNSESDFVGNALLLARNPRLLETYKVRAREASKHTSWRYLATQLDEVLV